MARSTRRDVPASGRAPAPPETPGGSGRKAVSALVLAILALWLGLHLAFRGWQARYRALAEFGAVRVAPAVDPLAATVPPGVPPDDWHRAVADTHAMLLALTGAGVLDRPQMEQIRRDVADRVETARAETARSTLAGIWDDLERAAGPVIAPDQVPPPAGSRQAAGHPRPPRPALLGPPSGRDRGTPQPRPAG